MSTRNPDPNRSDKVPASSRRVITGSIAVSVAFVMELTLVPLLLPAIQAQFGLSVNELAWAFNSYGVAVAIGVLLGGFFGDTLNAQRVFNVGVLFFASGAMIVANAETYGMLLAGRIVQGFGGGLFSPLIPLLLTGAMPQSPGRILIMWGSVAGYVAALAPFLYGTSLATYGWTLAFVLFAVVSLVSLLTVNSVPAERDLDKARKQPPSYTKLFRSRDLWVMFIYVFCTYGSITYYLFRLPLWLAEMQFQPASIGLMLSAMWLSFSVVSTVLRNKVDRPHVRGILLVAPILIAAGFPLAYFCDEIICLVLSAALVGSGLACSNAPSTQLILGFSPQGMRGVAASMDITFARVGGVVIVAVLAESLFGMAAAAVGVLCTVAFVCAMVAVRSHSALDAADGVPENS